MSISSDRSRFQSALSSSQPMGTAQPLPTAFSITVKEKGFSISLTTRSQLSPYHAVTAADTRIVYFPEELATRPGMLPELWRAELTRQLAAWISNENIKKEYRLVILSQKGLRERILTYLTMQASRRQTTSFAIPFSREELAAYLCVNRSALSHELSRMQEEGLLTFRKNDFRLHFLKPDESGLILPY